MTWRQRNCRGRNSDFPPSQVACGISASNPTLGLHFRGPPRRSGVFSLFSFASHTIRQFMSIAISAATPPPTAMLLTAVDGKVAVAAERFAAFRAQRRLSTQRRYPHSLNQVEYAASVAGHVVKICYCVDQQCQLLRLFGPLSPSIVETTRSLSVDPSFAMPPSSTLSVNKQARHLLRHRSAAHLLLDQSGDTQVVVIHGGSPSSALNARPLSAPSAEASWHASSASRQQICLAKQRPLQH